MQFQHRHTKPVDRYSIFQELTDEYLQRYARAPHKRASSVRNDRSMLKRIILPRFGEMKVEAVGRRHIEDLRDDLSGTKYQVNRVLSLLSRMFSLAEQWDAEVDRSRPPLRNPVRGIKRLHEERCERWLKRDEMKRLLGALRRHPDQKAADAIRLILLTGCRKSEALRASWAEFDLEDRIWTKPSHHVKQRTRHHVALNADAAYCSRRYGGARRAPTSSPVGEGCATRAVTFTSSGTRSARRRGSRTFASMTYGIRSRVISSPAASPWSWSARSSATRTRGQPSVIAIWPRRSCARCRTASPRPIARRAVGDGRSQSNEKGELWQSNSTTLFRRRPVGICWPWRTCHRMSLRGRQL
jgi:integrase